MTRQDRWMGVSAALHGLLLLGLLRSVSPHIAPARFPGTAQGTHLALVYSPGRAASEPPAAPVKRVETRLSRQLKPAPEAAVPIATSSSGADRSPSQGNQALGAGNVTIALATYFPWPRPDLSTLAHGTRGDVVVDVTIDPQGRIVETQVAQSMGAAIDNSVLSTIQTWTFKPATENGVPVPSEQELLFHFEYA